MAFSPDPPPPRPRQGTESASGASSTEGRARVEENIGSGVHEGWMDELSPLARAAIRLSLGGISTAAGVALTMSASAPTVLQAGVMAGLFSFGVAMLSAFFLGGIQFRYKSAIVATGSLALFLILLFYFKGDSFDTSSLLLHGFI